MAFDLDTFESTLKKAFKKLKKSQAEALAVEISANFVAGMTAAEKHQSINYQNLPKSTNLVESAQGEDEGLTDSQKEEIALLVATTLGYLSAFNGAAEKQILAKVQDLLDNGASEEEIKQYVDDVFEGKESITIDNRGKTKKEIYVDKDLVLSEKEVTITKVYSIGLLGYAALIGANAAHSAYEKGKKSFYLDSGFSDWIFAGPVDERARKWHIALVGVKFTWNTEQSNLAEQVLREPRCRHRSEPFYNDPSKDVPKEKWDKLKEDAGLFWNNDTEQWDLK